MRFVPVTVLASCLLAAATVSASTPKLRRGPTAPRLFKQRMPARMRPSALNIAPQRAVQIQTALIKAGYLTGSPSGSWDTPTQAAMEKLQSDNGWQTKLIPDARAIIKLGLGSGATSPGAGIATTPGEEAETPMATEPAQPAPEKQ